MSKQNVYIHFIFITFVLTTSVFLSSGFEGESSLPKKEIFIDTTTVSQRTDFFRKEIIFSLELTPHEPISIVSDDNFTDYGFPGFGNISHPYIIENYNITDSLNHTSILIQTTTKHFLIQNCFLSTEGYGIFITDIGNNTASIINNYCSESMDIYSYNASGIKIYDNTLAHGLNIGIEVYDSDYIEIINNTCLDNQYKGIYINTCDYSIINNNNCTYNSDQGIYISHSSFTDVINNSCSYSNMIYGKGIKLYRCNSSNLLDNICVYNCGGFGLKSCNEIKIEDNLLRHGDGSPGISLIDVNNSILTNNVCYNYTYGIALNEGKQNVFSYNILEENKYYGISLFYNTFENVLYQNHFINNNQKWKALGEAQDLLSTNTWYNKETKIGNWWSDLGLRCKYKLDGEGEAVDIYPINKAFFCLARLLPTVLIPLAVLVAFVWIKYVIPFKKRYS